MAEPFLSEIRIFSFVYAPQGWALCNGQFLPINQNQALFSLLGTTFGGNGQTNFALPNMMGKVPIHEGSGHTLGETGGAQSHTLTISQLPTHVHPVQATSSQNDSILPGGNYYGATTPSEFYTGSASVAMNAAALTNTGGSQAHLNMQPFLVLSFCIALQGIFPSQN